MFGRHVLIQRKEATRFCQQRGYFFFFFPCNTIPPARSSFRIRIFLFSLLHSNFLQFRRSTGFIIRSKLQNFLSSRIYLYTLFTSLVTISISHDFFFSFFLFFFSPPPRARIHSRLNKYRFCQTSQLVHGFVPFFD